MIKNTHKNIKIVISGANGFVGDGVIRFTEQQSAELHVLHRRPWTPGRSSVTAHHVPDMANDSESVINASRGADIFIHLAGRAHQSGQKSDYEESVVKLTENLVLSAAKAGVKRFIYMSTILVHGTKTFGVPFNEDSLPDPQNWYAASKWKAEQIVKDVASKNGMEYVIIRPPLVYGPNLKGNLKKLVWLIKLGVPLPFKSINNKRSLIGLENLSSFIWQCCVDERAKNQTYTVSDGTDVSTPELISYFAKGLNRRVLFFSFPMNLLYFTLRLIGKEKAVDQLTGSLQVDNSKSRYQLGWSPIKPSDISIPDAVNGK